MFMLCSTESRLEVYLGLQEEMALASRYFGIFISCNFTYCSICYVKYKVNIITEMLHLVIVKKI